MKHLYNSILIFLLVLSFNSCVFKGEFKPYYTNVTSSIFDNIPPEVEIVSPTNYSTISNKITVSGKAYDENSFFVFVEFDNTNVVFTNTEYWFFNINTFDFTNGPLQIKVSARDILGNTSTSKTYSFYISNTLQIFITPNYTIFTNTNFSLDIRITSTNYSHLKIISNGSEWFTTNNTTNLLLNVTTNRFFQGSNTLIFILDNVITNKISFVFDFSPPNYEVFIRTNQYIFGNYLIGIFVNDDTPTICETSYGNITNYIIITNGTNFININTFLLNNGTNSINFRFRDLAGNSIEWISFTVIVANFYSTQILRENNKNKYYLNCEIVSNNIRLYFTDNNFSSIFIAREENNFSKETVKQTSLNILDNLSSLVTEKTIYIAYIRDDSSLIVRTNHDLTNFYQMFSDIGVSSYSIFFNSNAYILRIKTNDVFLITDISNKNTNFITNLPNVYEIYSEKYSLLPLILYGCYFEDGNFVIFTNYNNMFSTNVPSLSYVNFVSFSNSFYLALAFSNTVNFLYFSNNIFVTNIVVNFTNTINSVRGIRKEDNAVFGIVSTDNNQNIYLDLIEFNSKEIIRKQPINNFLFKGLNNSRYFDLTYNKGNLYLFVPFVDYTYSGFYVFTGL